MCLGIPGRIVDISDAELQLGIVDVGGIRRPINLSCIAEEGKDLAGYIGHWVLVHVGFAMSLINDDEAQATLAVLNELGEVRQELAAIREGAR